jgi:hypothetical protein
VDASNALLWRNGTLGSALISLTNRQQDKMQMDVEKSRSLFQRPFFLPMTSVVVDRGK